MDVFGALLRKCVAVSPRVRKEGNLLVASSGWRSQLFTLGAFSRKVILDPSQKAVRIRARMFWFFSNVRRIPFDAVREVLYGYTDLAPGSVISWGAYESEDLFTVGLRLINNEELMLFRFFGGGDFVNNGIWPDWMYWDDIWAANLSRGAQESESQLFAELVAGMLGVPVTNPAP